MGFDYCWRYRARCHRNLILLNCLIGSSAIGAYAVNQWILKFVTNHWFIHAYFNDMFAPVVLLAWANLLIILTGRVDRLIHRPAPALLIVIPAGLYWEYVTPLYRHSSTTDPCDLVAYLFGAVLYLCLFTLGRRIIHRNEQAQKPVTPLNH
jgi:hypothetical protein